MKRLTRSNPSGSSSFVMGGEPIPTIMLKYTDMQVVLDRLAAYEDTGLMPEQIEKAMEDCADTFAESQLAICEINEMGAIDHLRELIQAEKAGRLVVLPCKVGDKVKVDVNSWGNVWNYKTYDFGKFLHGEIVSISIARKQFLMKIRVEHNVSWKRPMRRYPISALGKTVFLTRSEAEAALKKEGKNNEAD